MIWIRGTIVAGKSNVSFTTKFKNDVGHLISLISIDASGFIQLILSSDFSYNSTIIIFTDCSREHECFSGHRSIIESCSNGSSLFSMTDNSASNGGCGSGVIRSETQVRSSINLLKSVVIPGVRFSMYNTYSKFPWRWLTPFMRYSLFSPSYIIIFLIFFFQSNLIFTTFWCIDGLCALVFIAFGFPIVSTSIFPVDCVERGLWFGILGILPYIKWMYLNLNTEGKGEQFLESLWTVRFTTSSISIEFNCFIILFDYVCKF